MKSGKFRMTRWIEDASEQPVQKSTRRFRDAKTAVRWAEGLRCRSGDIGDKFCACLYHDEATGCIAESSILGWLIGYDYEKFSLFSDISAGMSLAEKAHRRTRP